LHCALAARLRIEEQHAAAFIARWWVRFPAVRALRDPLADKPRLTPWGRCLPNQDDPAHIRLNHLVQGSGRDVFCAGLLAIEDAGLDDRLPLPLHDEYVLHVPNDTAEEAAAAGRRLGALPPRRRRATRLEARRPLLGEREGIAVMARC
jgi:hypothetical protein